MTSTSADGCSLYSRVLASVSEETLHAVMSFFITLPNVITSSYPLFHNGPQNIQTEHIARIEKCRYTPLSPQKSLYLITINIEKRPLKKEFEKPFYFTS